MKSAYDALSDPKKRKVYDALGHQGMDFVVNPSHAYDPHVLMGNLAKSSVLDRAKLMMLVLLFFGLVLIQPILICAKVDQMLYSAGGALEESMWVVVLVPFWLFSICFGVVMVIGKAVLPLVQWIMFVLGVLMLTLKWDSVIRVNYAIVFIPFYLWMALRWLGASKEMKDTRTDMSKMVTIDYIEKYILNEKKQDEDGNDIEQQIHRTYNDLTEEERDEINETYIIVHVPPKSVAPGESPTAEQTMEADLDQIERSAEYQEATIRHQEAYKSIQRIVLPEIPLIIMVIIQLDMNKNWNWGLVFIPLWISMFLECCGGCYGYFCTGALAHIEVQESMAAHFAKQQESAHEKKESKDEADVKSNADKVNENVEASKLEDSKPMTTSNSEETTETAKDGEATELLAKSEVDTAVVVEPLNDVKEDESKGTEVNFPEIDLVNNGAEKEDDEDEFLRNVFSMDEDTFQYYQQAEQEAESKATEAQSKAIASFCNIFFQIVFSVLFVVKLNQVYDERDRPEFEGDSSFSSFWIIFPLLLVAGCTSCCCFCAIFCAGEVDTHMMSSEVATEKEEEHAEEFPAEAVAEPEAKANAKEEGEQEVEIQQTSTSEGMELDIEGQAQTKVDKTVTAIAEDPTKKESDMDDLD